MPEKLQGNHEERKPQRSELERRQHDLELVNELEEAVQDRRPQARIWSGARRWWLFGGVAVVLLLQALFPQYMFRHYHSGDNVYPQIGFEVLVILAAVAVGYFVLGRRSGF